MIPCGRRRPGGTVVRGYRKEMVNLPSIKTIDNDLYERSGEAATLACAIDALKDDCLIALLKF